MPVAVSRAAIRAARSAAALPLDMVAAAAGTSTSDAAQHLRALKGRGVSAAAANLGCPPEALRVAARSEDDSCRSAAARNLNCPADVLGELLSETL